MNHVVVVLGENIFCSLLNYGIVAAFSGEHTTSSDFLIKYKESFR